MQSRLGQPGMLSRYSSSYDPAVSNSIRNDIVSALFWWIWAGGFNFENLVLGVTFASRLNIQVRIPSIPSLSTYTHERVNSPKNHEVFLAITTFFCQNFGKLGFRLLLMAVRSFSNLSAVVITGLARTARITKVTVDIGQHFDSKGYGILD